MQSRYPMLTAICIMVLLSMITDRTFAQIPNASFENWSGGNPVDWLTTNSPPSFVNVTQASPGHAGSFAAQGSIVSISGFPIPIVMVSGPDGQGYPNTSRPAALHGWYKYTPISGDAFVVVIALKKNGQGMGGGAFSTSAAQSTYREFVANILYSTGENPDSAVITAQITNGAGQTHAGSAFILDDLFYGAASADVKVAGSDVPAKFVLNQNYPNPFNPSTTIRYELPKAANVRLEIFNMLGQQVATLVDGERAAGVYTAEFNALNLSSGTYFYKLQAGGFTDVKRLMLLK